MDLNGQIAALLRDFAAVQTSKQSIWGYKRAASAILALDEPIDSFLQPDGTLRKIPNIGPSSTRIIVEVLHTGTSATVERAIADSGQTSDIERRRDLRGHFLSRAQVVAALDEPDAARAARWRTIAATCRCIPSWSDGSQTLDDIVEGGLARGYDLLRRDRSFVRAADRRRRVDGGPREAAPRNRRAERKLPREVSPDQRHRGEHPRRRLGRHGTRTSSRGSRSSSPRRIRRCGPPADQTAADGRAP